jgi:hypothetical protein
VSGIHSSEQICAQPNASNTHVEQAMKLAEEHALGLSEGKLPASRYSIASFDNVLISKRAAMLGVSVGSSPSEIASLISMIKDIDLNRTMILLKKPGQKIK